MYSTITQKSWIEDLGILRRNQSKTAEGVLVQYKKAEGGPALSNLRLK